MRVVGRSAVTERANVEKSSYGTNPLSGRLRIWPPLNTRQHKFLVRFLRPAYTKSLRNLSKTGPFSERASILVRQLLQSGYIKEVRTDDSDGPRETVYKASTLGLVDGLIWEDDCWKRIDDIAANFAEEIPIPFESWDIFVKASRTGTMKVLAEAILESTRDWKTIGIHFVSELSEAPCLGSSERIKLLKALGSIPRDTSRNKC